ncbi:hypothetical protein KKB64_05530 [Patescibacteria group bacterium]|nr:hypothetical protein [Patescibacteria group bacterium]MBU2459930.1 hypothetical protein [Patescibacteria group bacterium]
MSDNMFQNEGFNPAPATTMHIDLNSCFASIEQQANPLLRGKPLVVAAYTTPRGCILAVSREAKKLGIKTGMRVAQGRALSPGLVVLPPDPEKYRFVNRKLTALLASYTPSLTVASIDEMVMDLVNTPILDQTIRANNNRAIQQYNHIPRDLVEVAMVDIALEIKKRIKQNIGEWLTVSIGIAPNRYLAKLGSGLHKPDGLDIVAKQTIDQVLSGLRLEDLVGIKEGYGGRLRRFGISTPMAMYRASVKTLVTAFSSIIGRDWWLWLHGWNSSGYFDQDTRGSIKSIGHSYALPEPLVPGDERLHRILAQLVHKIGRRLRFHKLHAYGVAVQCLLSPGDFWQRRSVGKVVLWTNNELYQRARSILLQAPDRPVRILAVTSFGLRPDDRRQLDLFDGGEKRHLTEALDRIEDRWGDFTITSGRMLGLEQKVLDRIAFGKILAD